ncbi:hypothetical protein GGX14DRAFT_349163 [Mycena pura]|uniref:Uncharacterized protein n=1 Tax=Mycena pura TaxID=153505 RepID=A0AAD7E317_9AGAR|nr:hypothetical protein GGX14DRAFT_349163 [Mycena pura]
MANADTLSSSLSELTAGGVTEDVPATRDTASELISAPPSPRLSGVADHVPVPLAEPTPIAPVRSSLVPLGSQAAAVAAAAPPQPKRFSAVNINKKFLEKTSSSTSAPVSANSTTSKTGAKLTAAPQTLSAAGPGWSRPSSATPPATTAHTVNGLPAPVPSGSSDPSTSSSSTQHPHSGSTTQQQPRPLPARGGGSRDNSGSGGGAGKLAWGNAKSHQPRPDVTSQSDFPTAAEGAPKPTFAERNLPSKEALALAMAAAANKQARMEEADTFRGVHLDPNAHHWDEMEEDDDNFLDGVIEFGDGRQYKIESAELPTDSSSATLVAAESISSLPSPRRLAARLDDTQSSNVLVSKEERFADDFDRSWPRSRASPSVSTRELPTGASSSATAPSPVSPAVSMGHGGPLHSPQDVSASRALLFNERSNKLEPYNRAAGTVGSAQKRGSDAFPSPTDTRGREFSSTQQGNNIQVLQNRGRGSNGGNASNERQQSRRDTIPAQQANAQQNIRAPPNPWTLKKDSDGPDGRGRRLSAMGPPPVPASHSGSGGRQRPPHLPLIPGQLDTVPAPPQRRPSTSREARPPPPTSAVEPTSVRRTPSQSPSLSHASAIALSPVAPVSHLSGAELDEARKDVMQSAAARAKARKQQEEEEREKERERARRKAAEIEERMKATETGELTAKKTEQGAHNQSATKSAESKPEPIAATGKPASRRPSMMGSTSHSSVESRSAPWPTSSSGGAPVLTPLQTETSWRSKASPISATAPTLIRQIQPRPAVPTFVSPPTALDQVTSLAENPEEELEVVDFSDLGKFIGVTEEELASKQKSSTATPVRPPRPVASDFFDDRPPRSVENVPTSGVHEKPVTASWRRQSVHESPLNPEEHKDRSLVVGTSFTSDGAVSTKDTSTSVLLDHHTSSPAQPPQSTRTPRSQPFHKEAAMSALDDVMSRIKGAIDGMQTSEKERRSPEVSAASATRSSLFHPSPAANLGLQKERWVPPAFRSRQLEPEPQEVFVTGCEPPRSPKPAWNMFVTRLPKKSRSLEPVNRKQLVMYNRPMPLRWDILSFDPPVEGMSRREFTVNEILFRRNRFKGKSKYQVLLPRKTTNPRVNIPITPRVNAVGAFGRSPADGLSTWRKPPPTLINTVESETGLSTMSRSPPPELPSAVSVASIPRSDTLASPKSDDIFGPSRSRSQPKMPVGTAVAFYRDSRVDSIEPDTKSSVNFIVSSELEDSRENPENNTPSKSKPSIMVSSPASNPLAPSESLSSGNSVFTSRINGMKPSLTSSSEIGLPSLMSNSKAESKSSDDSTDRAPITPPSHHTLSWARSSHSGKDPIRGPDPEHLKAVWSQSSNKAGLHAVNSLEGIADDLTAIPFTLQDVKSEDGGTPPPITSTSVASSRMSLTDVTRAFQQVPSSSSSSSHRPPFSPPSTSAPVARPPPTYPYPPPHPNPMMRPTYGPYSPMMSSPTPSMMYPMAPSPVPARMSVNGHSPLYSQPVWMAPQNSQGMMRPMGSPYPQQLMPYPSPGTPMYAQPSPLQQSAQQQQQQQSNASRGRGMSSVMSPVMPHQNVMYPSSPILMHAPPMPVGYMNVPVGRGQTNNNGHPPLQQQQHPQHQPNGHPIQPTGYNLVPSSSFMRPTW